MNDALGMPQSAVVVGGSSEIAAAVLRALAAERLSRVVLGGRDTERLEIVAKELGALGVEVHTVSLDVTEVGALGPFAAGAASRLGNIDLVLVAAGVLGDQEADSTDPVATAGPCARSSTTSTASSPTPAGGSTWPRTPGSARTSSGACTRSSTPGGRCATPSTPRAG